MAWLLFMVNWDDWSLWTNQIVALNWSTFLIIPVRKYDNIVMNKLHYCKYKQIWMHVTMSVESWMTASTMAMLICTQQINSTHHHQLLLHNRFITIFSLSFLSKFTSKNFLHKSLRWWFILKVKKCSMYPRSEKTARSPFILSFLLNWRKENLLYKPWCTFHISTCQTLNPKTLRNHISHQYMYISDLQTACHLPMILFYWVLFHSKPTWQSTTMWYWVLFHPEPTTWQGQQSMKLNCKFN
jgi:hypothetical protein